MSTELDVAWNALLDSADIRGGDNPRLKIYGIEKCHLATALAAAKAYRDAAQRISDLERRVAVLEQRA